MIMNHLSSLTSLRFVQALCDGRVALPVMYVQQPDVYLRVLGRAPVQMFRAVCSWSSCRRSAVKADCVCRCS